MSRKVGGGTVARAAMLVSSLTAAAFVFTATETVAQAPAAHAMAKGPFGAEIGKPMKPLMHLRGHAAKLRTLADIEAFQAAHPSLGLHQPTGGPLIPMGKAAYEAAKRRGAAAQYAAKPGANSPPVADPPPTTIVRKFTGPTESGTGNGAYPPDGTTAISPNGIVVAVNSTYNVYSRTGSLQFSTTFAALLGSSSDKLRNPRVLYDPLWKRWIFTASDLTAGYIWLAFSKTSNAKGAYWVSAVNPGVPAGDVCDYLMAGMTQDALLFTCNLFDSGGNFVGAHAFANPKAKDYNGIGWSVPLWGTAGTLAPPIELVDDANAYFIATDTAGHGIHIYKGTNLSNELQATLTYLGEISAPTVTLPPRDAYQPGTALQIDTGDGRFQSPSTQYFSARQTAVNPNGDPVVWNVSTGAAGGFPDVNYYEIDMATSPPSIVQTNSVFQSASSDDFNGSLAVNINDEVIVNWTATDTSNSQNAMMIFSGLDSTDGAIHLGSGTVLTGSNNHLTGNTKNGVELWGSSSSVALDPYFATNCGGPNRRAAIVNEYAQGVSAWAVKVGIVGFC